MYPQDAGRRSAHQTCALYIVHIPQTGIRCTGHAGKAGDKHQAQCQDHVCRLSGPHDTDDHHSQQNAGECSQHIAQPHQNQICQTAEIAGQSAQQCTKYRTDGHRCRSNGKGGSCAFHHATENITAEIIGTQQMLCRRRAELRSHCHCGRIIGSPEIPGDDHRYQHAEEDQSGQQIAVHTLLFHASPPSCKRESIRALIKSANVPAITTQKARITTIACTTG